MKSILIRVERKEPEGHIASEERQLRTGLLFREYAAAGFREVARFIEENGLNTYPISLSIYELKDGTTKPLMSWHI